jgi:hypothetical protein
MQPAIIDLTIYKGSTYSKSLQWKTGSPATPVNLTGCTARMQIRPDVTSNTVLDTLTTENGKITIVDATQGKLRINLTSTQTAAYNFTQAAYDLEVVYPGGEPVYRLIEGCVSVDPEVTR